MTAIRAIDLAACPGVSLLAGQLFAARLVALDGRDARIERAGGLGCALAAFGCIVRPEPGDLVLACEADGETWVVSVLERTSASPLRLWAEGDVELVSARGDVSLAAAGAISADAGASVRIAAPDLTLLAGAARFVIDDLLHVGRRIALHVAKIRSVGELVETFAEHVLTRARRSSRFVEEGDSVRAGDVDHRASGTMQLQARVALLTAETVVRVDAEQIHMG